MLASLFRAGPNPVEFRLHAVVSQAHRYQPDISSRPGPGTSPMALVGNSVSASPIERTGGERKVQRSWKPLKNVDSSWSIRNIYTGACESFIPFRPARSEEHTSELQSL